MIEFISPSQAPDHHPTKVRRSKDGRPYVKHPCPNDAAIVRDWPLEESERCEDGKVAGKRPLTTKQCPKCKGKGYIEKLYTRCTTFVSALEERTNLEKWKMRIVLVGLGVDHDLLDALDEADPDDRDELDDIASEAFEVGEGHSKARKGTDLHRLTEYVDKGDPLPEALYDPENEVWRPVTLQDRADLAAWQRTTQGLGIAFTDEDIERFVVNDEYQIGGTYDRLATLDPAMFMCEVCTEPMILDLKTGRTDYGQGKIAQQLAVYAHSDNYDPETGERTRQDVCQHIGIVIHLPQGTGEAEVLLADLVKGWEAVALSAQVRQHRSQEKSMLYPLQREDQK